MDLDFLLKATAGGVATRLLWNFTTTLIDYLKLKEYLLDVYSVRVEGKKSTEIYAYAKDQQESGEKIFWMKVFTGELLEGDMVKLLNFQISPWFPRKPGLYWTNSAAAARKEAEEKYVIARNNRMIIFDIYGKTIMSELGGIGSINFRKNRNDIFLTATASGHTDRGIPIICSSEIWKEINNALMTGNKIEADIQGTIEQIPIEYDSFFLRTPNLPKIALRIMNDFNIDLKRSASKIIVNPWTIFTTSNREKPFGFTFVTHKLFEDDLSKSIKWIKNYICQYNGENIITDFDEETNPLNAMFPLNNCMTGIVTYEGILQYCQKIWDSISQD